MTSGDAPGTNGGNSGTSGGGLLGALKADWPALACVAVAGLLFAVTNATSRLMERGPAIDPRAPWVWEFSSYLVIVPASLAVFWMVRRFPPPFGQGALAWTTFVGAHMAGALAFSLLHVAGMVALRQAAYAAVGETYDFGDGKRVLPFLYEMRKDLLTYVGMGGAYWLMQRWLESRRAARSAPVVGERIELRDGARVVLVEAGEIVWLEAAGNYVEIHTAAGGAAHLARGTLASFEERLGPKGFVRVHRSRLVNRAKVRAFRPTPSGDFEITLQDGRTIAGSRRFRPAVEELAAAG